MTHGTRPRSSKRTSGLGGSIRSVSLGRRRDREIPAEGAPARTLPAHHLQELGERPRREARNGVLERERVGEGGRVAAREGGVVRERLRPALGARERRADLAGGGAAEVERGADALARERQAVAGAVAGEE